MAKPMEDQYWWSDARQVLTAEQHGIPGVHTFGHSLNNRALTPLETHIHPDCLELVLMVKGNQTYTMEGKTYPLSGGNVFISPPGMEHSSGGEPQNVSEFYWVQIDLSAKENFLCLSSAAGKALQDRLSAIRQQVLYCGTPLRQLLIYSFQNVVSSDPFRREYGRSLLISFLYGVILQETAGTLTLSEEIAAAVTYIRQNIREPLPLEDLADCAGLSLSRFKARFKQETGMTPREYINQLKIREARKLLREGHSITETAMELGFSSSSYFAVLFKKITLYTPQEYRKKNSPAPKNRAGL